jgi:metal-dependent amidase/aminoacylase/carboxypeptidase family protein
MKKIVAYCRSAAEQQGTPSSVRRQCGHDGHTTMLLGAARYLAETRDFAGTVHFIFQPAEEGIGGAKAMLQNGLFKRFPCDSVFGMHNWTGSVGSCPVHNPHYDFNDAALPIGASLFARLIEKKLPRLSTT